MIGEEFKKILIEKVEQYCEEKGYSESKKRELIKKFEDNMEKYLYEPGEAIGVVAAQSISEPATQMTMRSYSMASTVGRLSKVTLGLPRLIEIFDARKTFDRTMRIYLKSPSKEKATEFAEKITEKHLRDVVVSATIDIMNMRIEMELKDDPKKVKEIMLEKHPDLEVSYRGSKLLVSFKQEKGIKELIDLKSKILDMFIGGVKGILEAQVFHDGKEYYVMTFGSNLKKIIEMDEVDVRRLYTNDFYEVQKVFGIEAARQVILRETISTMKQQGLEVDYRHIITLIDTMTAYGEIMSIGRYGVAGSKSSIFARANFEETVKHLVRAAIKSEEDRFEGIIENVMIGKVSPVGTGTVELSIDLKKLSGKNE